VSILTIASQKGGVGKTTTAVNLAACLALSGKPTLLFDFDPQGNASSGVGLPRTQLTQPAGRSRCLGILSSTLANADIQTFIQTTRFPNLSVLPASHELSRLDLIQEVQDHGLEQFKAQLRTAAREYDYVLIDCPPSLGGLPTIALTASDSVLIPVQCEYYAMEGLSQILPIIHELRCGLNISLRIVGLLLTMFSPSIALSVDVVQEIEDYFGDTVFRTIIPRDVVLAESSSHGLPVIEYAPLSPGAWSYVELAKEVLDHDRP
jgi:chromosome partitioning protein